MLLFQAMKGLHSSKGAPSFKQGTGFIQARSNTPFLIRYSCWFWECRSHIAGILLTQGENYSRPMRAAILDAFATILATLEAQKAAFWLYWGDREVLGRCLSNTSLLETPLYKGFLSNFLRCWPVSFYFSNKRVSGTLPPLNSDFSGGKLRV